MPQQQIEAQLSLNYEWIKAEKIRQGGFCAKCTDVEFGK